MYLHANLPRTAACFSTVRMEVAKKLVKWNPKESTSAGKSCESKNSSHRSVVSRNDQQHLLRATLLLVHYVGAQRLIELEQGRSQELRKKCTLSEVATFEKSKYRLEKVEELFSVHEPWCCFGSSRLLMSAFTVFARSVVCLEEEKKRCCCYYCHCSVPNYSAS